MDKTKTGCDLRQYNLGIKIWEWDWKLNGDHAAQSSNNDGAVLYCTVLYCIVLYCIVLSMFRYLSQWRFRRVRCDGSVLCSAFWRESDIDIWCRSGVHQHPLPAPCHFGLLIKYFHPSDAWDMDPPRALLHFGMRIAPSVNRDLSWDTLRWARTSIIRPASRRSRENFVYPIASIQRSPGICAPAEAIRLLNRASLIDQLLVLCDLLFLLSRRVRRISLQRQHNPTIYWDRSGETFLMHDISLRRFCGIGTSISSWSRPVFFACWTWRHSSTIAVFLTKYAIR
jgi:hypothetical protein